MKAQFFTDFGDNLEVKPSEGNTFKLDRYGVWGDKGKGKAEVIETSNDLEALKKKYGDLPCKRIL